MMDDRKTSAKANAKGHPRTSARTNANGNASSPGHHPQTTFKRSKSNENLATRRSQVRLAPLKQVKSHARISGLKRASSGVSVIALDQQSADEKVRRKQPAATSNNRRISKFHVPGDDEDDADDYEDTDEDAPASAAADDAAAAAAAPTNGENALKAKSEVTLRDDSDSPGLQLPLHKSALAPPQISNETVVAVSSPESAATEVPRFNEPHINGHVSSSSTPESLHGNANSGFAFKSIFDDNNNSSWVDLERMSKGSSLGSNGSAGSQSSPKSAKSGLTTRTQQRLWLQRQKSIDPDFSNSGLLDGQVNDDRKSYLTMSGWSLGEHGVQLTTDQRKVIDRIGKELNSIRRFGSPLAEAVDRCRTLRKGVETVPLLVPPKRSLITAESASQGLSQSLPKRTTSLSATTLDKLADSANSGSPSSRKRTTNGVAAADMGAVPYLLSRMWSEGWQDKEEAKEEEESRSHNNSQTINSQAQVAAAHLQRPVAGGTIKLA